MARALSGPLDAVMLSKRRSPSYQVFVYDVRSTETDPTPATINDIVAEFPIPGIVGPREFTADVRDVQVQEIGGDLVDGLGSASVSFTVIDHVPELDPVKGSNGRWLRQGNVVRVVEGDTQVPVGDWQTTFTGKLVGQPGAIEDRTGAIRELQVRVLGRTGPFLQQLRTTQVFDQGVLYTSMIETIAQDDMNLFLAELDFPSFGTRQVEHLILQFVDEPPIVAIAKTVFGDGFTPRFQGDGKLTLDDNSLSKPPARIYTDGNMISSITRPPLDFDGPKEVIVKGLDKDLSEREGPEQLVATAMVTMGYYTQATSIKIRYSDDATQQVRDAKLRILRSVNGGLHPVGSEEYNPIPIDVIHTDISVQGTIDIDAGFNVALVIAMQITTIGVAAIPDLTVGFIGGSTIAVGRLIEAVVATLIGIGMQKLGNGEYEILGKPIEYIYEELTATARFEFVPFEERNPIEINNHLLNTQGDVDAVAIRTLDAEGRKQNSRIIRSIHDLRIEVNDVIETFDGRRFFIQTISRTLVRRGQALATMGAFEITSGVRP